MPIGVAFCFGPVLVAWWLAERKAKRDGDGDDDADFLLWQILTSHKGRRSF